MDKQAGLFDFTGSAGYLPHVVAGGAALGASGRLVKNLADLLRGSPSSGGFSVPKLRPAIADIPVEVTEEEAEELRKRGIKVKRMMAKRAAVSPNFWGGIGYGALGAGSMLGGWALLDKIIDSARKRAIKGDISRVQRRIENILEDRPENEDEKTHAYMKAAEDFYFSKIAHDPEELRKEALFPDIGFGTQMGGALGLTIGAGGLLSALAAYNKAKGESKYQQQSAQLARALKRRRAAVPSAALSPYVYDDVIEEEEEKQRMQPVVVVEAPGSPAQQAATNKSYPWI